MFKKLLYPLLMVLSVSCFAGLITSPFSDKSTGNSLTAVEINDLKNNIINEVNGNLNSANLANNAITTEKITDDAVTPAKLDEDNANPFVMSNLTVTYGLTATTGTFTGNVQLAAGTTLFLDGGNDTYITEDIINQINFYAGGTNVVNIAAGSLGVIQDIQLAGSKKLYLDGGSNTFLYEPTSDVISLDVNGSIGFRVGVASVSIPAGNKLFFDSSTDLYFVRASAGWLSLFAPNGLEIRNGGLSLESGEKLWLDNGVDTYIYEPIGNVISFVVNDAVSFKVGLGSVSIPSTNNLYFDGGGDTYFTETSGDVLAMVTGGITVMTGIGTSILVPVGVRIGQDGASFELDDATQGGATSNLFIGNGQIALTSDVRLKMNIEDTKIDSLGIIDQFRVVDFDWNDKVEEGDTRKTRGKYTGMLAQEVIKITPWIIHHQDSKDCELCTTGQECEEHPQYWQVQYGHLVPTLIKAIQEQQLLIGDLQNRLSVLETK